MIQKSMDIVRYEQDRLAIVDPDRCKSTRCNQECKKFCPVVRIGKKCVEVEKGKSAVIAESLCTGCGICVKKCPYDAIKIVRLPTSLATHTTHRYGPNGFKLHKLPNPRRGGVLGLVGENGVGKTTVCKIFSGKIKLNLGNFNNPPSWDEIIKHFRGSSLQNFFKRELEGDLKVITKPQHVTLLSKVTGTVKGTLDKCDATEEEKKSIIELLSLEHILDNEIKTLSGGELQRFAIARTCLMKADMYIFDEPCAFLDVRQRLNAAKAIRSVIKEEGKEYVVVVEHDLSVLDYICKTVSILYGTNNAFGVVTQPCGVREAINMFMGGYIKSANVRFRPESLVYAGFASHEEEEIPQNLGKNPKYSFPSMKKTLGKFELNIKEGKFGDSDIIVMVGENGTGKSTFIRLLAGIIPTDDGTTYTSGLTVSYKPQVINCEITATVRDVLNKKLGATWLSPVFTSTVIKPLDIMSVIDQNLNLLSGGELQRVFITLCLGQDAHIYLLDEPSTFLDVEQRINLSKVIKRFIRNNKKIAFVVEHDLTMATYLADRFVTFEGQPGINCTAQISLTWDSGISKFLQNLGITMRIDPLNGRPRINKPGSRRDREQKHSGDYLLKSKPQDVADRS